MAGYIFISYSRKDQQFAEALANNLTVNGLNVWIDKEIVGGDQYGKKIQEKIKECACVLVILSPDSASSDWVEKEMVYAEKYKKPIVPVLWKDCDIPIHVVNIQYADFRIAHNIAFAKLTQMLRQHSSLTDEQPENKIPAPSPVPKTREVYTAPPIIKQRAPQPIAPAPVKRRSNRSFKREAYFWIIFIIGTISTIIYLAKKLDHKTEVAKKDIILLSDVTLFADGNANSIIGKLKYGITYDSLQWLLALPQNSNPKEGTSFSSKRMIYIKNIPANWIQMNKPQQQVVTNAWLMPYLFNMCTAVDSSTYRLIRSKNFNETFSTHTIDPVKP